jgi:DNA-binding winged helix-turn-helix (wHTH) protein
MKLIINQYVFDSKQQLLTKDSEIIALSEKPTMLLAMFLADVEKIHKKEDILATVWPDRIVSDQVVFQNISFLRSLFGSDAIKTFSKKGYQWQIPVAFVPALDKSALAVSEAETKTLDPTLPDPKMLAPKVPEPKVPEPKVIGVSVPKSASQSLLLRPMNVRKKSSLFILCLLLMGLAITWLLLFDSDVIHSPLADIQADAQQLHREQQIFVRDMAARISQTGQTKIHYFSQELNNKVLFHSPFHTWNQVEKRRGDLLLATQNYHLEEGGVLRFYIQGAQRGWQGYIEGELYEHRVAQLEVLLRQLAHNQYFSIESDNAALAQLTIMNEAHPENLLTHYQLIKFHFESEYYDLAAALADTYLDKVKSSFNIALLHLMKVEIMMRTKNWQSAGLSADIAVNTFKQLGLSQLESLALIQNAWISVYHRDILLAMQSLNMAAIKARQASEPLQEIEAHLIQAVLAGKTKQPTLRKTQLDLAEQLIELHHLSKEHHIPILNNMAWQADDSEEALSHCLEILDFSYSPRYRMEFYNAAEFVRNYYLERKAWSLAKSSIKSWQRTSFIALSNAHIAFSKSENAIAVSEAKLAFQHGRVDFVLRDALDAALLLLTYNEKGGALDYPQEYVEYIKQNASRRWISENREALDDVTLLKGVAS